MKMNMAEKILAAKAGKKFVEPGELVMAKLDMILANDITAPIAIQEFKASGAKKVFDRKKVALVPDHFTPNKDIKSAEQAKILREFAYEQKLTHYYDQGEVGIEHALLPEKGVVVPGDLIIGADSHTCTYGALGAFATGVGSTDAAFGMMTGMAWFKVPKSVKFVYKGKLNKWVSSKDLILHTIGDIGVDGALYMAMEFTGPVIDRLSMDARMTMSNMAIEAGGKAGLIAADETTIAYVKTRAEHKWKVFKSDPGAKYEKVIEYDCSKIEPVVSVPHLPENTKPASKLGKVRIDQSVIGSCTNGRMEDMRITAKIFKGKKINSRVRCLIFPGTRDIYLQCVKEGLVEIFVKAGAVFSPPTCGPCLGGHMGILAKGETAIATTNRNFIGRMGSPESFVYLSSPAVAAASALTGRITNPEELYRR
ncbi:MAG TPA: 3-isopropylmalate dehydratase large subunit [bacterium]|nr:3-isopropylmalate dehydratase large subunit [bacterium]